MKIGEDGDDDNHDGDIDDDDNDDDDALLLPHRSPLSSPLARLCLVRFLLPRLAFLASVAPPHPSALVVLCFF